MKVGIVGATGWLGSALGGGLLENGIVAPADMVLLNRSGPSVEYHGERNVVWAQDAADLVARTDVVVVAVRPQDWDALALVAPGRLLISLMACVSTAVLTGTEARIVRAMPNAAAELGRSYTPWLAGPGVTVGDRTAVRTILSAIGIEDEVSSEAQIDFLTALSGSGAAYPALMTVAMLDAAREAGLSEQVSERAVAAVILEGAAMLRGRIGDASAMIETYRSYRGTTAAGLAAAESAGFRRAVTAALSAATRMAGTPLGTRRDQRAGEVARTNLSIGDPEGR
jgi:pyrroline-5-carboxylate reductase